MQVPQPAPAPPELPEWLFQTGPDPMQIAFAVIAVLAAMGAIGMIWTVVRGFVSRWSRPAGDTEAIEGLKQTVQQLSAEVGELHERMDFAERMLAAHREPARLDRPEP